MSEGNKFVIRRSFEELWNKGNLALADELFARLVKKLVPGAALSKKSLLSARR